MMNAFSRRLLRLGIPLVVLLIAAFFLYRIRHRVLPSNDITLEFTEANAGIDGMAAWLAAYADLVLVPDNSYAPDAALKKYLSIPEPEKPMEKMQWNANVARSYLNTGKPEESFPYFKEYFRIAEENPAAIRSNKFNKEYYRFILETYGISYMRQGEIANCLNRHTPESCIFPIQGGGIHVDTMGAANAFRIYRSILAEDPGDHEAVWLLNVSAMALGVYPDSVPEKFLLHPNRFASAYDIGRFTDVAPGAGVAFNSLSGGVCMDDFDNDGYLDIICSGWQLTERIAYFHNNGDGSFDDWSASSGLGKLAGGLNMVHADYDNDGLEDVLVLRGGWWDKYGCMPNSLLRNLGNGKFEDMTWQAGLHGMHPSQTARFEDFNKDGWLDIFVGNEATPGSPDHPCELYISNGDGTFKEVGKKTGAGVKAFVKASGTADYDNDGDVDIILSVYKGKNILLQNRLSETGKLQFKDVSDEAGISGPNMSFPCFFFDFNNDGYEDIYISSFHQQSMENVAAWYRDWPYEHEYGALYRNNGDGTFSNITTDANLEIPSLGMSCNFGDIDNDGYLDFYLGTGNPDYRSLVPNLMFRNDGNGGFQNITTSGGFGHLQKGHGIAMGDVNRDGDLDIYAVMGGALTGDYFWNALYDNPGQGNHFIGLRLVGKKSSRDPIGARVVVHCTDPNGYQREICRTLNSGGSFGSSPMEMTIGLGIYDLIEKIEITWPDGSLQTLVNPDPDARYKVVQGNDQIQKLTYRTFTFATDGGHGAHHMNMDH